MEPFDWVPNPWKSYLRRRAQRRLLVGLTGIALFLLAFVLASLTTPSNHWAAAGVYMGWILGLLLAPVGLVLGQGDQRWLWASPDRVEFSKEGFVLDMDDATALDLLDRRKGFRSKVRWAFVTRVDVDTWSMVPGTGGHRVRLTMKDGTMVWVVEVAPVIAQRIKSEFEAHAKARAMSVQA